MSELTKTQKLAQGLNELRIVPRILVAGYGVFLYEVGNWFMALPDPTGSQAAFVSTMVGAAAAFFGLYCNK